jgi:ATP-dependent DNA helicase RecG
MLPTVHIEAWGCDIQRILSACREAGTPEPQIRVEPRDVWVDFPFSEAYLGQIVGGTGEVSSRATAARDRGLIERLGERLGETDGRALLLIRADPRISTHTMAEEIGVSMTAIDKTLARLKDKGIPCRVGPARGGDATTIQTQGVNERPTKFRFRPKLCENFRVFHRPISY